MTNDKVTVHDTPNPIMETVGLMYLMVNKHNYKESWINDLVELGINGQVFIEKHANYVDDYIEVFEKHYQEVEPISQFIVDDGGDMDTYFHTLLYCVLNQPNWLTDFDSVSEEIILESIIRRLSNKSNQLEDEVTLFRLRTTEKFIIFLNECDFTDREKWLLLQLYTEPKRVMGAYVRLVAANINAYEKAFLAQVDKFNELMVTFKESINTQSIAAYKNLIEGVNEPLEVFPCFVFPDSLALIKDKIFYGSLISFVPLGNQSPEETRDFLQVRLKALADSSKLQIMSMLKDGEMYNLEIAERLNLTPATTFHHMNVLMATGLVGINKQQGKVYYHLEQDIIKEFMGKLEDYLL